MSEWYVQKQIGEDGRGASGALEQGRIYFQHLTRTQKRRRLEKMRIHAFPPAPLRQEPPCFHNQKLLSSVTFPYEQKCQNMTHETEKISPKKIFK